MRSEQRRAAILSTLQQETAPVSASTLARQYGVSRQIIVGDVALLRAAGADIAATPRGYVLSRAAAGGGVTRQVACNHRAEDMVEELNLCVDQGCAVLDVVVEHPVYGQLVGQLQLYSRYDVQQFAARLEAERAHALSELTDGIHLHTLRCPDEAAYQRVCQALEQAGFLYKEG
ncbi:MAG: transcription repressor NadR [Clostridiales bacterium]|nr:transcription repressor NadR [Clostridiales bacterium]MCD8368154.1 transcription repressor NadR [Clostridiales bacterium]